MASLSRTVVWQGHKGAVVALVVTDASFNPASFARPNTVRGIGPSRWLFTAGDDGDVRRYDLETAQCVDVYDVSSAPVLCLRIVPRFRCGALATRRGDDDVGVGAALLLASSLDTTVHLFDVESGNHLMQLNLFRDPVTSMSMRDSLLFCGSKVRPRAPVCLRACVLACGPRLWALGDTCVRLPACACSPARS